MEDGITGQALAPRAAPHYVLEPDWPHRAVPVGAQASNRVVAPRNAPQDGVRAPLTEPAAG